MAKIKAFSSPFINSYAQMWKDYEFLYSPFKPIKHLKTVCASTQEFKNFSFSSREFSGKTLQSKLTEQNRSQNYQIYRSGSLYLFAV